MKLVKLFLIILILVTISSSILLSQKQAIHESAWREVSARAVSELDHKYGLYNSRTLSVYNPEIYLQADSIWLECFATKFDGWKNDYTYRPEFLHTEEVYWDSVFMVVNNSFLNEPIPDNCRNTKFTWQDFKYNEHIRNVVHFKDFYDTDAPFFNWLDQRLPLLWNAMRGKYYKMSYFSLAEAFYFEQRSFGNQVYLMFSDQERGYVTDGNKIYDPLTRTEINSSTMVGRIILIMNQKYVWYPLFNRDDSMLDAKLRTIITKYSINSSYPSLSSAENEFIPNLISATKIKDETDKILAIKLSGHFGQQYMWRTKALKDLTMTLLPTHVMEMGSGVSPNNDPSELGEMNYVPMMIGNRLSPSSAILADLLKTNSGNLGTAFSSASDKYMSWFKGGQDGVCRRYYWLWTPSFEDKVISNVGNCNVEGLNMASAIVNAKVSNWDMWFVNWWGISDRVGHIITGVYEIDTKKGYHFSNGGDVNMGPLNTGNAYVNLVRYNNDKYILAGFTQVEDYFLRGQPFTNQSYADVSQILKDMSSYDKWIKITKTAFQVFPRDMYTPTEYLQNFVAQYESTWEVFNYYKEKIIRIRPVPDKPKIVYPQYGRKLDYSNFKIVWNKVKDADLYDLNISSSYYDISNLFDYRNGEVLNIVDTTITFPLANTFYPHADTKYYYRVRAKNNSGNSEYAIDSLILGPYASPVALIAPQSESTVATSTINFRWTKSYYADYYSFYLQENVYNGCDGIKTNAIIKDTLITDTTKSITKSSLKEGRRYYWMIWWKNINYAKHSESAFFIIPLTKPANVTAVNIGKETKLTWDVPIDDGIKVIIERKKENGEFIRLDSVLATQKSFTDNKVEEGIKYSYRIFSSYDFEINPSIVYRTISNYSSECMITSLSSVISKPTDLVLIARGNKAELRWIDNSENETGFIVQKKINNGSYNVVDTIKTTKYIDSLLVSGKNYYRVYAYNEIGISPFSNVDSMYVAALDISNNEIPTGYNLFQNYPNPFNPTTKIKFGLPESAFVKLIIYDNLGREVKTLLDGELSAGFHEIEFNAGNLASGIYLYQMSTPKFTSTKKLILMK